MSKVLLAVEIDEDTNNGITLIHAKSRGSSKEETYVLDKLYEAIHTDKNKTAEYLDSNELRIAFKNS